MWALAHVDTHIESLREYASRHQLVLVPLHMTPAMSSVIEEYDWTWQDLLVSANAITEAQYESIEAADTLFLRQIVEEYHRPLEPIAAIEDQPKPSHSNRVTPEPWTLRQRSGTEQDDQRAMQEEIEEWRAFYGPNGAVFDRRLIGADSPLQWELRTRDGTALGDRRVMEDEISDWRQSRPAPASAGAAPGRLTKDVLSAAKDVLKWVKRPDSRFRLPGKRAFEVTVRLHALADLAAAVREATAEDYPVDSDLIAAAHAVLEGVEDAFKPPIRDELEIGRMVRVSGTAIDGLAGAVGGR